MSEPATQPPPSPAVALGLVCVLVAVLVAGSVAALRVFAAPAAPGPVSTVPRLLPAAPPVTCAGRTATVPRQLRGMWLTTVGNRDWPSRPGLDAETIRAEYRGWLDVAQRMNHNAIFVHVRPSGDAFWPSAYAPWSQWLTGRTDGQSPGWDPMAFLVAETHARNMEFHAWFNPYKAGQSGTVADLAPNHPLHRHPDWAVTYPTGTSAARVYFNPGIPKPADSSRTPSSRWSNGTTSTGCTSTTSSTRTRRAAGRTSRTRRRTPGTEPARPRPTGAGRMSISWCGR